MQRIYGYAFFTKEELDQHLHRLEEAKRRDHRKLGRELDLFSIGDDTGPGLILWHPKGGFIRKQMEDFWRDEHVKGGYDIVYSPHVAKLDLWKTSGHTEYYKDAMFAPMDVENVQYQLKPMNCPFHIQIYKSRLRSYRELPFRYAELGTVYRFERSGVLHGLMRVRGFTQDDAHIFCRPDQLEDEILRVLDFTTGILKAFGFDRYDIYLSTRPEKSTGHRRAVGAGHERAQERPARSAATPTRWTPAKGSSTGRRSTSRSRTPSTGPGSARPSRWISTTRTASASSTSARTTRPTSRSWCTARCWAASSASSACSSSTTREPSRSGSPRCRPW